MDDKIKLFNKLSPHLFWEYDMSKMDIINLSHIIIERVFEHGLESDEIILFKLYSLDEIKNVVTQLDNLSGATLEYLSSIFDINKRDFKCYGKKLSHILY